MKSRAQVVGQIKLSKNEKMALKAITSRGMVSARKVKRARTLLLLDEGKGPKEICESLGCAKETVNRTGKRYLEAGLVKALEEDARPGKKRALSKQESQRIIAMVCGPAPPGQAAWTVRLIAKEAKSRGHCKEVGRETIRVLLKSHDLKPWREKNVVRTRNQR
jgi:transposase